MLHLLTIVYGDCHVGLFKNACLRSLSMDKNKAALANKDTVWHIYTDEKHMQSVHSAVREALPELTSDVRDIAEARRYVDESLSAFVMCMEECLKDGSPLIFAPPDIFFGDGSIPNMIKVGYEPNAVVTIPHIRVTPDLLMEFPIFQKTAVSNAKLVTLGWKNLHRCWGDAELDHPRQNQYGTGVLWQRLDENTVTVTHRLPTPYFMKFTTEDLQYFQTQAGFGHFDHKWPGDILIPRGRQRAITSSDVAFMCEITEAHKNISNMPGPKNEFWAKNLHNNLNAQYLCTFRGE